MAEENGATLENATTTDTTGEAAQGEQTQDGFRRERRQHTPSEELYDLSKPIPREEKPDKTKHDDDIEAINTSINALKDEKQVIQDKIDDAMEGGRNSQVSREFEALQSLFRKKSALINEKKGMRSRLDFVKKQADTLINERKAAKANMRYGDVESINTEIKKLKRRQETTSMSLGEEKRLIKDMDALESSKKYLADVKTADASITDVKESRKSIQGELNAKDKEIDAVQVEIDEKKEAMGSLRDSEKENNQNLTSLKNDRDELKNKIGDLMDSRNALRQEFREANNKWYDYQRAVKAQKKLQYDEKKKKENEEYEAYLKQKEEEEAKKVPYEEEMGLCDYLVAHLTKTYLDDGKKSTEEKKVDVIEVKENPFAGFKPVNKKTDDTFFQFGKGKKKLRVRASKKKAAPAFKLTVDSFEQFGFLHLTPPTKLEEVQKSVEDLEAKKEWYKEQPRGSVPTAREIRKANEKAAASARSSSSKTSTKKNGKLDISGDDFAPLSSTSGTATVNATWGQKHVEEEEVVDTHALEVEEPVNSVEPSD